MDADREQQRFLLINGAAVPVWLAMILAPRSRLTARLVRWSDAVLFGLSAAYVAQLVDALEAPVDPGKASTWRGALSDPKGFLTGWTHFVAFDLFVGRWIWQTALRENRSPRLAVLLTWFAGPAGLALFAVQRRSLRSS